MFMADKNHKLEIGDCTISCTSYQCMYQARLEQVSRYFVTTLLEVCSLHLLLCCGVYLKFIPMAGCQVSCSNRMSGHE